MSRLADSTAIDPPGFSRAKVDSPPITDAFLHGATVSSGRDPEATRRAFEQRAMSIAQGQMGAVFQVGLMLWLFIGNQLNLYSIFFLLSMGTAPIKNLLNVNGAFAAVQHPGANLMQAKLIFIALNLVGTGVFLWKLRGMGLLPVTSSDWVSLLPDRTAIEHSALDAPVAP